jgi:hypothetical protein
VSEFACGAMTERDDSCGRDCLPEAPAPPSTAFSMLCSTSRERVVAAHVHSLLAQDSAGGTDGTKEK